MLTRRKPKELNAMEARILAAIPFGRDNAIIADAIQVAVGTERERRTQQPTRQIITDIILKGHPVCSSPMHGFWRPTSRAEVYICVASLRHRIKEIEKRASALSLGARFLPNRTILGGLLVAPMILAGWIGTP